MASAVRMEAAVARARVTWRESAASPSLLPTFDPSSSVVPRRRDRPETCPEIDCVRERFPVDLIADAERRAAAVGVGADRVLIAAGAIDEETYVRALADALGITFEPLEGISRAQCPVTDNRLIEAPAAGMLPLSINSEHCLVVAPRGTAARRIISLVDGKPELARRLRLTSAARMTDFVLRHCGSALADRATNRLHAERPALSAAPRPGRAKWLAPAAVGVVGLAALLLAPTQTMLVCGIVVTAVFIAWLMLRLVSIFIEWPQGQSWQRLSEEELPVYTILSALYSEASSVDGLLNAIECLDYPPEKLDVKLVIESDDAATRAAIHNRKSRIPIEVIVAPLSGPRTKPKALNAALPFARGSYIVIYDAEDRPERSQLRRALQAFGAGDDNLACVQARLSVDNTSDSWLARCFTAEFAGQFDVFFPGIATLGLPLPLGGSSNHFRTATLHKIGAWDPYNVTEDADLGMRLARFGYRAAVINSTTYEEAPAQLGPWLRQRTRWFKGWMQTWRVHMREPRQLLRDLGAPGFLGFQLMIGGNVFAALIHPVVLCAMLYEVMSGAITGGMTTILGALYGAALVGGYAISAFLGWVGLARRGLLSTAWVLALTPLHWLFLSLAAWRAVLQLVVSPYRWEKTEHGLAQSSRRRSDTARSLRKLERYLSYLLAMGVVPKPVPEPAANITYISAARQPTPRAAA